MLRWQGTAQHSTALERHQQRLRDIHAAFEAAVTAEWAEVQKTGKRQAAFLKVGASARRPREYKQCIFCRIVACPSYANAVQANAMQVSMLFHHTQQLISCSKRQCVTIAVCLAAGDADRAAQEGGSPQARFGRGGAARD